MMMTNGVGAFLGSKISGFVIDTYFTGTNGQKQWHDIWLSFSGYALIVAVLFLVLFRYKHKRTDSASQGLEFEQMVPN